MYNNLRYKINQYNNTHTSTINFNNKKLRFPRNLHSRISFYLSQQVIVIQVLLLLSYKFFLDLIFNHIFCTNCIYILDNVKDIPYLNKLQFYIHYNLPPYYHKVLLCAIQAYDLKYILLLSESFFQTFHNLNCKFCTNHNHRISNEKDNPYLNNFQFCILNNLQFV